MLTLQTLSGRAKALGRRVGWLNTRTIKLYQARCYSWALNCFPRQYVRNYQERGCRFLEEAVELAQTARMVSREQAHAIVDYVYDRPVGLVSQEVGGVMVTLSVLCSVLGINLEAAAITEIDRIEDPAVMAKIRTKQVSKVLPAEIRADWECKGAGHE